MYALTDLLWLPYSKQTISGDEGRSKDIVKGLLQQSRTEMIGLSLGCLEWASENWLEYFYD